MRWTLTGTARCDALLGMGEFHISAPKGQQHECIQAVLLEKPRTVEGRHSTVASEFDLKLRFEASAPKQAHDRGTRCAQEVSAALAFLASASAEVQVSGVTSAPDEPVPGTDYTTLCYPVDGRSEVPPTTVPAKDMVFLILPKPERVTRALRWIEKSHLTDNALDEFTCLMVAFESLSQLLKEGGGRYWHCSKCHRDITQCPECGASTESRMSGVDAMREFVVGTLGWPGKGWTTVWKWRCRLLHGEADVSADEEHAVAPYLPRLEEAVVAATKKLSGLPPDHSPTHGRHRPPFSEAVLVLNWHK